MIFLEKFLRKNLLLKDLKNFLTKYKIPIIVTLIYISFFSFWHIKNNYTINFDSSRYYARISHISFLLNNASNFSLPEYSNSIKIGSSLWITILSFFTYILNIESINMMTVLNNILSVVFFIFIMHYLICIKTTKRIADYSILLICFSHIFFNLQKVLLPEMLSFTLSALSLNSLINIAYKKDYIEDIKLLIYSYLSYLTNSSTLIIIVPALLILSCLNFKKFQRIIYFIITLVLLSYLIIPEKVTSFITILIKPDISGSWLSTSNYSIYLFLKNLLWQIFGFIDHTLSIITVIFFILTWKLKINRPYNKNYLLNMQTTSAVYMIIVLALIAWIRPLIANDFYATGYRYQIPLLIIFFINFAYLLTLISKRNRYIILSSYILISLLTILYQSIPSSWHKGILLSLKVLPDKKLCQKINWNGNVTIFNGLNNIVSGGGQSKFTIETPFEMKAAKAVIKKIKDEIGTNKNWITIISKLETFHHNINTLAIQKKLNWIIQGDQKNPFISVNLLSKLENTKKNIPQYRNMKNSIIQLLESNFIVILNDDSDTEPEMNNIYQNLLYIFKSNKNRFELKETIKIDNKTIYIYRNKILLRQKKFPKPLEMSPITFGAYNFNKSTTLLTAQYDYIQTTLINSHYQIKEYKITELKNVLLKNLIQTLILPNLELFPASLYDELLIFYQRGGNLWFTDAFILQKDSVNTNNPELSNLYDLFGFEIYNTTSTNTIESILTELPLKPSNLKESFGLIVKHGMKNINFRPFKGNFFPHRIPTTNSYALIKEFDKENNLISIPLSFHTSYKNSYGGSSYSKILFNGLPSLNDRFTNDKAYENFIKSSAKNFTYPLIIEKLTPSSLIITKENKVNFNLRLKVKNSSKNKTKETFTISLGNNKILTTEKAISTGNSYLDFEIPSKLLNDEFLLFSIKPAKNIYQKKACLVINNHNNIYNKKLPPILIHKNGLNIAGNTFITGVNYYPSSNYDLFWNSPDLAELYNDFKNMEKMSFKMVRMHYIHSNWYLDVNRKLFKGNLPLKSCEFDSIKIIKSILYIARHFNIYLCFDIFSLVGEDMGSCTGWTSDLPRFTKPEYIKNQNIFLIKFLKNLKEFNNFTIDLINEPEISKHNTQLFKEWVNQKINIIKELRPDILVTTGFKYPGMNIPRLDYSSVHLSSIQKIPARSHPVIIQEFWHTPYLGNHHEPESTNFKKLTQKAINTGYRGFMPWCYRSPSTLYNNQGLEEKWENSLGFFKKSDGTKKN